MTTSQAGKSLLVETCKQLAEKVKTRKLIAKDINQGLVDKTILGIFLTCKSDSLKILLNIFF